MRGWWRCVFLKHVWERNLTPRLFVLNDGWELIYTDGMPEGDRYDCKHCGASQVR